MKAIQLATLIALLGNEAASKKLTQLPVGAPSKQYLV